MTHMTQNVKNGVRTRKKLCHDLSKKTRRHDTKLFRLAKAFFCLELSAIKNFRLVAVNGVTSDSLSLYPAFQIV